MSPGRRPSARKRTGTPSETVRRRGDRLVLDASERRDAMVRVIDRAKKRLVLSLFRCDDFAVLDALAAALERGVEIRALLTKRAKGGRRRLQKLWASLEDMDVRVGWYADPVAKYHAKYLVLVRALNGVYQLLSARAGASTARLPGDEP